MPSALMKQRPIDLRKMISAETLQSMITTAVKNCGSDCELFVGVFVERTALDENWDIRGIRFGRADRNRCTEALAIIVEHFQQAFGLSAQEESADD